MIKELKTIEEIKSAVDNGKTVVADTHMYHVTKDKIGQYLIKCTLNGYCIGLSDITETRLNAEHFYVID